LSEGGSSRLKTLLDYATKIGVQARYDRVEKAQIENLLASLEMVEDPQISPLVTAAYAHRQAARLKRGYRTAKLINEAMEWLYRQNLGREEARRLLGMAKWIFESLEKVRLSIDVRDLTFQKLLGELRR